MSGSTTRFFSAGKPFLIPLFLVLLVASVYWQVGGHNFIELDDSDYVTGNYIVRHGISNDGIFWAFTTGHASNWHPLTWLSHMLDVELFGLDPGSHHLVSVAIHAVNTVLLFLILRSTTEFLGGSMLVAALFAVHPLHIESVAWVAERKDVLSAMFFFLALIAYLRYARRPGTGRYLAVAFLFVLGLMAKPMLVTLPCVLLLMDYWPLGRVMWKGAAPNPGAIHGCYEPRSLPRLFLEKSPLFLLAMVSSAITIVAQKTGGSIVQATHIPFLPRMANALVSYAAYVWKTFWPSSLAIYYPHPLMIYPQGFPPWWQVAGGFVLLVGISGICLWQARSRPYLVTGWFWFIGMMVPVIGVVQVGVQAMADRYTYLPSVGLFFAAVWAAAEIGAGWRYKRIAQGFSAAVILLALSYVSFSYVGKWKDGETIIGHALSVTKNNWMAHFCMGNVLGDQGRHKEAIDHYSETIRITPDFADAHNNMGNSLRAIGRKEDAIFQYQKAILLKPDFAEAHNNLGIALGEGGFPEEAIAHYRMAMKTRGEVPLLHYNLGNALLAQGRRDDAVAAYRRAVQLDPQFVDALYNLAVILVDQGRVEEGIANYREVLRLRPAYPEALNNLGFALASKGRFEEAKAEFQKALALRPGDNIARRNLENVMGKMRNGAANRR